MKTANSKFCWFVEVAMLKPTPTGEGVMLTHDVKSATEVEFTGTGSAPAAGDYPNAALEIGIAHYVDDELVAETLTVPIHLVVGE